MKPRFCPCGKELKPHQKCYCSNGCRAKYLKVKPKSKFGYPIQPDNNVRVGVGIMAYLYGRRTLSDNNRYR